MKRAIAVCLIAVGLLSAVAFADAPIVSIGFEPSVDSKASLGFGWDFDSWKLIGSKTDFSTWMGRWAVCAFWTPPTGFADVRIGPELAIWWDETGLFYNDMAFVVGVEKVWGASHVQFGLYGELKFSSNYGVRPELGVLLEFPLGLGAE
ncbi:MAG: hypothetical protein WC565_09825 [Parcubacteria group bacterium]